MSILRRMNHAIAFREGRNCNGCQLGNWCRYSTCIGSARYSRGLACLRTLPFRHLPLQIFIRPPPMPVPLQDPCCLNPDHAYKHGHQPHKPRLPPHWWHHGELQGRRRRVHVQVLVPRTHLEHTIPAPHRQKHRVLFHQKRRPISAIHPVRKLQFLGSPPGIYTRPRQGRITRLGNPFQRNGDLGLSRSCIQAVPNCPDVGLRPRFAKNAAMYPDMASSIQQARAQPRARLARQSDSERWCRSTTCHRPSHRFRVLLLALPCRATRTFRQTGSYRLGTRLYFEIHGDLYELPHRLYRYLGMFM